MSDVLLIPIAAVSTGVVVIVVAVAVVLVVLFVTLSLDPAGSSGGPRASGARMARSRQRPRASTAAPGSRPVGQVHEGRSSPARPIVWACAGVELSVGRGRLVARP
jgi:hypothetical protein